MRDGGPSPTTDRDHLAAARRQAGRAAVQHEIFLRVTIAAIVTFAIAVAAAYVYLVPFGQKSVRAIVPVLDEYMRAAAAGDPMAVHRLYSSATLQALSLEDVRALLAQRELFDGYSGLRVTALRFDDSRAPLDPDRAVVSAVVTYEGAGRLPNVLTAQLALENDRWRFDWLRLARDARADGP